MYQGPTELLFKGIYRYYSPIGASSNYSPTQSKQTAHIGLVCLLNTGHARVTVPHLREVYHLASYTGNNGAGHIVILSQVRECYSGGASIE